MSLTEKQKRFLDLLIDPEETFCVSHNSYGYHSISRKELEQKEFTIEPPPFDPLKKFNLKAATITPQMINMLAINPINGLRDDNSCTVFRTFLVEVDDGKLKEQMEYIKALEMPYSACVFSGNKSLHFAIALDTPLPSIAAYRMVGKWILNIVHKADQQTFNPSRSIRFPDNLRRVYNKKTVPFEKRKIQKLLEIKERISQQELFNWLNKHKDKKPITKTVSTKIAKIADLKNLSKWAKKELRDKVPASIGRNKTWYSLGYDFCLAGYQLDDTYNILESYFAEEHDFPEREWKYAIQRGYNDCLKEH